MIIGASGGARGVRDLGAVDSAVASSVAQPQMSFGGQELYPTLAVKAAALSFSLINNHPFVNDNKRIGYENASVTKTHRLRKRIGYEVAAVFLELNGFTIDGSVDEQAAVVLQVAAGETARDDWTNWLREHVVPSSC